MQSKIFTRRILFVFFLFLSFQSFSQKSLLINDKIIYYGIDFTKAKFVGKEGFTNPKDLQENYLKKWNSLILDEASKYNIPKYYKKNTVVVDINEVTRFNEKINPDSLVITTLSTENKKPLDLNTILAKYTPTEEENLGLLYAVMRFDKVKSYGITYTIFFNTKTKEILYSDYEMSKPGGFGIRNYWASTIHATMKYGGPKFKKAVKQELKK